MSEQFKEGLTLSPDDPVYKLIVNTPDLSSNPVGEVTREALVSKLKGATPGRHTEPFGRHGDTFLSIFFPHYSPARYEDAVSSQTGLDNGWWSNFSTAVLCQSMYYQTSDLRGQLKIDDINRDVNDNNNTLKSKAVQMYVYVLLKDFMNYNGDLQSAKDKYIKNICTVEWVTYKMKQYNDGTWKNPEWEEFNHWVKLSALGASDSEISTTIKTLKTTGPGLRIYPDVDSTTWRSYTSPWFKPNGLSHQDIDSDAKNGELRSVYIPSYSPHGWPTYMKEENSFEFTANSQPGSKYRHVPSSSCFSGNTMVLMQDYSLKAIKDVKSGEYVQTRSGPHKVAFVSAPPKGNRKMYSINNLDFGFTHAHPFLDGSNGPEQPHFLAISPLNILHTIPMLSYEGIAQLRVGSKVLGFSTSNNTFAVEVTKVEDIDFADSYVYDLVLEPNSSGQFEYIIGVYDTLFVVASELPTFHNASAAELAAGAIIMNMVSLASNLQSTLYNKVGHDSFQSKLVSELRKLSSYLFYVPIDKYSVSSSETRLSVKNQTDFLDNLLTHIKVFNIDGTYNVSAGISFEYLMAKMMHQIASNLALGYRIIPTDDRSSANVVAISLFNIHLIASPLVVGVISDILVSIEENGATMEHFIIKQNDACRFGTQINKVLYIPFLTPTKAVDVKFKLTSNDNKMTLQASTYFSEIPFQGQLHYHLPIFAHNDEEIGMLNADMRCLTRLEREKEENACLTWDNDVDFCKCCDRIHKIGSDAYLKHLEAAIKSD